MITLFHNNFKQFTRYLKRGKHRTEPRVPIDARVVETKSAAVFCALGFERRLAGHHLHRERAKLVRDVRALHQQRSRSGRLVQKNLTYTMHR